ncbi:Vacuolar protein sorting-associated protein 62 [Tulasnella sp. JGI-2019a]|nr:Vacuolar protein sorting-associated protein 62 [Tulasnella sp. JGI-2019a]KAG9016189.1 Vacuolar protein sorting-associated protein 62 [Tulasnella sp. JGI-2019a]KAG9036499.1 Vacuolar protein sorting-associated protein 62 [Tulasnella sp. JGI-2019a]
MSTLSTEHPPLPSYALIHSPLLWLNEEEQFWPGNPLEHAALCVPQDPNGNKVPIPDHLLSNGEFQARLLEDPTVDKDDVFLCLAHDDPRVNARIEDLMSTKGKPDPLTRRSSSPVWIIMVDKSAIVEPGVVDVFYFYFYPYNLGNIVAFNTFGNHVGDWEHSMVRFKNGEPIAVHLSAHADGHSWAWQTMEKMENRPVGYVASGSHAMYGKNGKHAYSLVSFIGPIDYTSKGVLWDPALNYCAARYDVATEKFSPLSAALPSPTTTAFPPQPGAASLADPNSAGSTGPTSTPLEPAYNKDITPEQTMAVLNFRGRWGNSFWDLRQPEPKDWIHWPIWATMGLSRKLACLKWAGGPSGPRWKSLERKGVTWNTTELLPRLV